MNKPIFTIKMVGAQDKSPTYDTFLSEKILKDMSQKLFGTSEYEVVWVKERNVGRLIQCEYNDNIAFISLSPNGHIEGRNYYFQSVCTAIGIYLKNKILYGKKKKLDFYFYFLPFSGNNLTDYHKFQYRLLSTAGVKYLNMNFGLNNFKPVKFSTVKDLILTRNELRKKNSGNQSTYVTDEGNYYHLYGKTFGANQKETTILCLALSAISDKPIKLFQILDNDSLALSTNDIKTINEFSNTGNVKKIEVLDDSYQFDDDDNDKVRDNLRSPKFIYNLLQKYNGEKKCALCGCKIESIVQAAHIYPVAEIRKRTDIAIEKKIDLAVDGDNGIWLCENHHKLFDKGLIWFEEGKLCISKKIDKPDSEFIKEITTIENISNNALNERMLAFFDMRAGLPPRLLI